MSKRITGILIIAAFLAFATTAHAASDYLFEGMMKKLFRGVVNTLTGWVEFPAQIAKGYNEGFMGGGNKKALGAACGILEGIWHSAGRTLSGVTDIIGFWAANPEDNVGVGIPLDGKYAWVEGEPYDMYDPNVNEAALVPVGKKLLRGAGNSLLGFLELPGQILKGISDGAVDLGIVRGLWYWYSREVSGLSDIATSLFPGPTDNMGVAFDEKWPWGAYDDIMR